MWFVIAIYYIIVHGLNPVISDTKILYEPNTSYIVEYQEGKSKINI